MTESSTESPSGERPEVAAVCNDCNEALRAARKVGVVARRLAMVADNAIANGDIGRARSALRDLKEVLAPSTAAAKAGLSDRARLTVDRGP